MPSSHEFTSDLKAEPSVRSGDECRRSGWRRAGDTSDNFFFFLRSAFWIVESLEG
jgi:hypothetical protein